MRIDLDRTGLEGRDLEIATESLLPNGKLRRSKPAKASGEGKYVWRMIAFALSSDPRHHCMPIMAECDLLNEYWGRDEDGRRTQDVHEAHEKRRARVKELDAITEAIVRTVPTRRQPGTMRWARAFGQA